MAMVMYKAAGTLKPSATSCVVDVGSRPILLKNSVFEPCFSIGA
jgi:hypothetical protein